MTAARWGEGVGMVPHGPLPVAHALDLSALDPEEPLAESTALFPPEDDTRGRARDTGQRRRASDRRPTPDPGVVAPALAASATEELARLGERDPGPRPVPAPGRPSLLDGFILAHPEFRV